MSEDLKFYTLLEPSKHKETLDFLQHNQTDITLKIRSQHMKSKILSLKNEHELLIYKFNFQDFNGEQVICSFEINAEQYFFTSELRTHLLHVIMLVPNEIFQLQRRNDFRVIIPANSVYNCTLRAIDGRPVQIAAEIRDLSLGGCQILINKNKQLQLQKNTEIGFSFKMGQIDRENIYCSVRHIEILKNNSKILMGLKFKNSDADFLTDLQGLLVQLDRIHRGKTYD